MRLIIHQIDKPKSKRIQSNKNNPIIDEKFNDFFFMLRYSCNTKTVEKLRKQRTYARDRWIAIKMLLLNVPCCF